MSKIILQLLVLTQAWGLCFCTQMGESARLSHDFMASYYVKADLHQAVVLCTGLAETRIRDQIQLGGGQALPQDLKNRQIKFKLLKNEKNPNRPDREELFFDLELNLSGTLYKNTVRLTLEKINATWKVANFVESSS